MLSPRNSPIPSTVLLSRRAPDAPTHFRAPSHAPSSHAAPPPKHAPSTPFNPPGRRVHPCFPFSSSAHSRLPPCGKPAAPPLEFLLPYRYTPSPRRSRSRGLTNTAVLAFHNAQKPVSPRRLSSSHFLRTSRWIQDTSPNAALPIGDFQPRRRRRPNNAEQQTLAYMRHPLSAPSSLLLPPSRGHLQRRGLSASRPLLSIEHTFHFSLGRRRYPSPADQSFLSK